MISSERPYVIGETAYNHEGDLAYLKRMVDGVKEADADAVKFHLLLDTASYMQKKHPLMEKLKGWCFDAKEWTEIINYSNDKGLDVIALCDDVESLELIIDNDLPVEALELHASGLNDIYSLKELSGFNGRVMLGVGGCTVEEVQFALEFLKENGKTDIILMYGFQSYPTNYADINLSKMLKLKDLFNLPIGYADHTAFDDPNNNLISSMAATMGFNILEKHFSPDPGVERIDYHASVGVSQLKEIKNMMEVILIARGDGRMTMSQPELDSQNVGPFKKAIVAKVPIKKGEILTFDNLWFKRTMEESSVKQNQIMQIVGLEAIVDIDDDEIVDFSKVQYKFEKKDLGRYTRLKE